MKRVPWWARERRWRLGPFRGSVCLDNVNRPSVGWFWDHPPAGGQLCISWGAPGLDPVWSLALDVPVPAWLERVLP